MSKRLVTLTTVLLLLISAFGVTQAQEPVAGEPGFYLTEEAINADFSIASTASREISNLDVVVKEDGIHVSYQVTVIQDGTSNTLSIIAILIGAFDRPRVSSIEVENARNSNLTVPNNLQREISRQLVRSWNDYEAVVIADLPAELVAAGQNQIIMRDGGICNPRWGC